MAVAFTGETPQSRAVGAGETPQSRAVGGTSVVGAEEAGSASGSVSVNEGDSLDQFALMPVDEGPLRMHAQCDSGAGINVQMSLEAEAELQTAYNEMKRVLNNSIPQEVGNQIEIHSATFDMADVPICSYVDAQGAWQRMDLTELMSANAGLFEAYNRLEEVVNKAYPFNKHRSSSFSPTSLGTNDVYGRLAIRPYQRSSRVLSDLPTAVKGFSGMYLPLIFNHIKSSSERSQVLKKLTEFEVFHRTLMDNVGLYIANHRKDLDNRTLIERLESYSRRLQKMDLNCVAWALAYASPRLENARWLDRASLLFTVMKGTIENGANSLEEPKIKEYAADVAAMFTDTRLEHHDWCHHEKVNVPVKFRDTDEERMFRFLMDANNNTSFFNTTETDEFPILKECEQDAVKRAQHALYLFNELPKTPEAPTRGSSEEKRPEEEAASDVAISDHITKYRSTCVDPFFELGEGETPRFDPNRPLPPLHSELSATVTQ